MLISAFPYILTVIVTAIIVLFVYSKREKSISDYLYIVFAVNIGLWQLLSISFESLNPSSLILWVARFALVTGSIAALFFYLFTLFYQQTRQSVSRFKVNLLTATLIIVTIFTILPITVTVVEGKFAYGPGYLFSTVFALVCYLMASFRLYNAKKGSVLNARSQINLILIGIVVAILGNLIVSGIFLNVENDLVDLIAPISTLVFSSLVAYAILRHKLFDISSFVARAVGYSVSIVFIATASLALLTVFSELLSDSALSESQQRLLFVFITIILAVSFSPFKRWFDRQTRRVFFRDAYDTQNLLNDFNKAIVSTIDADQLLPRAGAVIEAYLKPEWVIFAIRDTEEDKVRIVGKSTKEFKLKTVEEIRHFVKNISEKLAVTDLIEDNNNLKEILKNADIGAVSRVTTDIKVEGSGYILMGYKKSGNMYNSQDLGALEILSNELAIAIQNALQFEEIQKFNITLQDKVDEATKELKKSNEKLKQLDETKDEFISMASHQLRTPLTSVKGYLSMVIEGDAGDLTEMQKKLLDQAFISSQRMVYLIADLLNVSRLRTGKFIIDSNEVNLAETVEGEVSQLVETAKSRGLDLKYNKPKEFPLLMLDETKIRQVIMNFIDNAIYYTPKGGHIEVSLDEVGDSVELKVTDNGLGVPKHEQHNLFSKFFRANNAKKARPDGTGLGLFMAKKVIVTQGGAIIFSSEENKGSTFGFSFSKAKLSPPKISPKK